MKKISVIGSGVIDVLVQGVDKNVFDIGSMPVESTKLSFGGDALNESIILSRLNNDVELISNIGSDDAGKRIISFLKENGVNVDKVIVRDDLVSPINIVLVDKNGERFFLTNPNSSLRKLSLEDINKNIQNLGDIVSFAGMFISPLLKIKEMEEIFKEVKKQGKILCVDMTKRKNGEGIEDIKPLLKYIDYIFPNEDEISLLTGINDPYENAKILVENGVKNAVIKLGSKGCLIKCQNEEILVPSYKVKEVKDTTGAGDSFVAGFIHSIAENKSLFDSGKFANCVASFVVETVGATDGIKSLEQIYYRL